MNINKIFKNTTSLAFCILATPLSLSVAAHDANKNLMENKVSVSVEEVNNNTSQKQVTGIYHDKMTLVTGTNDFFGMPVWDFGGDIGPERIAFLQAYNPDGDLPLDITADLPDDALIASGVTQHFLDFAGIPAEIIDTSLNNIPLRQVPTLVSPAGTKASLLPIQDIPLGLPALSMPNEPITWGEWKKATGRSKIVCYDDGTSFVDLKMHGLIPNGLYTIWMNVGLDMDGNGVFESLAGRAWGGMPNAFVPDINGNGSFQRILPYCPKEDPSALLVNVVYHSDGITTGASPFVMPLIAGMATHSVLAFPLTATPL